MIAKVRGAARRGAAGRGKEPLDVKLSVAFRFGDAPEDRVVMMEDRSVPLVGTVFQARSRIVRSAWNLLFRAALQRPQVATQFVPALKLFGGSLRRKARRARNP